MVSKQYVPTNLKPSINPTGSIWAKLDIVYDDSDYPVAGRYNNIYYIAT
ncbi:hypothetical protein [Candidatus Bathycorpusculum sp.]|nr:hypothetical protein [Candidatus Termitimicrobium sp.]MCL2431440.1 hypothetical protein [Candidatus Termitimicrobium sp.]